MERISVYIIVYNQVDKIAAAIKSVLWADEVLVVDSSSTDGTVELASRLGARVVQVPFKGFGNLRNQAIDHCRYAWIFSLDSDERCTEAVRDEILSILHGKGRHDVYKVFRRNYFMGRWIKYSSWYPNYRQPQLFRKGSLSYTADYVHEAYVCRTEKPIGDLKHDIYQIPFRDLSEMIEKMNRYSSLSVHHLEQRYKHARMSRVLFHSIWMFVKQHVVKRGFLDGWPGFLIATGDGYGAFYRHAKLYEHKQGWIEPDPEFPCQ